jgi:hypothetical protein
VNCSYDGGITFAQTGNAFDAADVAYFAGYNNILGNLAIDAHNHLIYQTFSSIDNNAVELANCNISCHDHVVWIAVSIDGGLTFKDYPVYKNPNTNVDYGHQFINVSVDKAGNVYVVYDDNHNMYYSFSTNFGQSFTGPFQVNKSPSNTAIYPWSSAGNAGQLDIVWYGTSYYDGTTVPDNYPMSASWYVYYAQNLNALVPGSQFTQVQASGVIHHGGICESGVTCSGNRDLLDDFGIATSPVSGKAVIIYTSDQYLNTALEPATSRSSSSFCTTSDTTPCSHTDIAVQTSGPTVTTKGHRAEISSEDFEELDTSNDGGHSPQNEIDITNVDTNNINRIDIAINGLPLIATWNSPTPILPGQTVQGTSTSVPIGLNLIVGNVYQITVTATFSDGTTETQTINAIYSLDPSLGL